MVGKSRKSLKKKNIIICLQCKTEVLEDEDIFQCDNCNKTLHALCTKMDKKQINELLNNAALEYKCHFCLPTDNDSLTNELVQIKTKLNQLDDIKETIQFMSTQYDKILKNVAKNENQIEMLKKENKNLRKDVNMLKSSVKVLNDVRVQNNCIVNGVEVDELVKALDYVMDIVKETDTGIHECDIEECYFLKNKMRLNKKQSLVVKFVNNNSKKKFMDGKTKLKQIEKFQNVYINDFLSKETIEIFNHAKTLKKVGYNFVYSKGANIFAKKAQHSRGLLINSMDDVDEILIGATGGRVNRNQINANNDDTDDDFNERVESRFG